MDYKIKRKFSYVIPERRFKKPTSENLVIFNGAYDENYFYTYDAGILIEAGGEKVIVQ